MTAVERIPLGAGSPEGVNSAYALPDEGVVIDPGSPTETTWNALRTGLDEAGLPVREVEHVLVSHWHMDHAGLACRLAEAAGATVHMHAEDAPLVGEYAAARDRRLNRDAETLRRWGVPDPVCAALVESDRPSPVPDEYAVRAHADGDLVAGVAFVHTPGHTGGHASFVYEGTLFLGDLLLPTYTPNVGGSDTRMDDPLADYLQSIDRVNAEFDRGEPGHGTTVDIEATVASVWEHHRDRAAKAFRAVADAGEATPWAVARDLFGEMDGIHAKFGAGEAAAHLRRLAALGVVERRDGDPIRYAPRLDDYPSGVNLTP
ncbi:MBL fold metallo-hydrolase [Halostella pelagica]|uniref:MBL fold metallo-hydrolase n=1 Tax=Halostella pelagica TaxID=2583824 RepID=UPI001080CDCE|nr:MBL fold metallo-hydrolase [Halostella pelagica]